MPLLPPLPSHVGTAHFDACGVTVTMRVPLSPFPRWSQWGNRVAVTDWPEYSVDIFVIEHFIIIAICWASLAIPFSNQLGCRLRLS